MATRIPALIALVFLSSLGLSACGDADEVDEVEVEADGEVEVDD